MVVCWNSMSTFVEERGVCISAQYKHYNPLSWLYGKYKPLSLSYYWPPQKLVISKRSNISIYWPLILTAYIDHLLVRFCIPNFGTAFFGHLSNIKMSNFRTNVCFASRKWCVFISWAPASATSCPVRLFLLIPTNFIAQRVEGQTCLLSRLRKTNSIAKSNLCVSP